MLAVGVILSAIDLFVYFATMGPLFSILKLLKSTPKVKAIGDASDAPRRRATSESAMLKTPFPEANVATLHDLMWHCGKIYASCPLFGTRTYLGEQAPDASKGQRFPPKVFGKTVWQNYGEAVERMQCFGAGLRALGMTPQPDPAVVKNFDDATGNNIFIIYENTCADWMTAAQGCFSQSMVVSTCYATLGTQAVVDAVNEGSAMGILCNRMNVANLGKMASQMPSLKLIVYTDDMVKPEDRQLKPLCGLSSIKVMSMQEVCDLGKHNLSKYPLTKPKPDSMAVIMYTSGSTGKPKGVMIRHKSMLAMTAGIVQHFSPVLQKGKEVYAAFLPAAHILELCSEHGQMAIGCALGFCDPRTLTISGAEPHGALQEFRPTLMAAVPKIWDIIKKGAEAKAKAAGASKWFLFQWALKSKIAAMKRGMDTPVFNKLVFSKIKQITGGRLKIAVSGGGACEKEVQEFVSAAIVPLVQGYGLTETCGGGTVQATNDLRTGVVGLPLGSLEIKLVDAMTEDGSGPLKDANGTPYRTTDSVNAKGEACKGRGEVYIGGGVVTDGYYKMPKQTKEAYVKGGYFATGDVGEWTPDGALKIVDRKKNLVKLKGGEYVALEFMEVKFGNSEFVDALAGGIMVYAGADVDRAVAFCQCSKVALTNWAAANGISGEYEALLQNPKCRKAVLEDLNAHGKKAGLGDLEKLLNVTLLNGGMGQGPQAWTPVNGGLTPTNKLDRKGAAKLLGDKVLQDGKVDARLDWMKNIK
uniref:AMP-dependent synthetase/ligase domain-containing protein n=1 Tax=Hemiselmis andersenii TaxID=464988 RepID=A0A7S1EAA8_HEMAN|mmetsp:Transcript_38261/g.93111  ORF Transcript_38261/g.93111 Transcript_38261/m.93111 type:complete len:754 (+) Transcript_38261:58-2319(+)